MGVAHLVQVVRMVTGLGIGVPQWMQKFGRSMSLRVVRREDAFEE
jgi:hypothetical protein